MIKGADVRRHADGTLDMDFYRRRARKLRYLAKQRAWRTLIQFASRAGWPNHDPVGTGTQGFVHKVIERPGV
jgi:hypothetical protein